MLQITVSEPLAPDNLQQTPPDLQQNPFILLQVKDPRLRPNVPRPLPKDCEPPHTMDMQQNFVCGLQRKVDLQQNNERGLPARVDLQQTEADLQHPILSASPGRARGRPGTPDLQHLSPDLHQDEDDLQHI